MVYLSQRAMGAMSMVRVENSQSKLKGNMKQANTTTTTPTQAVVIWNAQVEAEVRATIQSGKSVSKDVALSAPKGFLSTLRKERSNGLRQISHLMLAQVESQGYKVEYCDANWNGQTKQIEPNKVRKTGDEVISMRLVKKAVTAEQKQIDALTAELQALRSQLATVKK
jgi:hypothetical protein